MTRAPRDSALRPMTHTTLVAPDNTGDYCTVRMTKAIANTASTAECDGPCAENSRFAAISATNFAVWSHIAPIIIGRDHPAATTSRLWSLRVDRNRRETRVKALYPVGGVVGGFGLSAIVFSCGDAVHCTKSPRGTRSHVDELLDEHLAHRGRAAGSAQKLLQVLATCTTAPTYC
jgi:hypothetical protein